MWKIIAIVIASSKDVSVIDRPGPARRFGGRAAALSMGGALLAAVGLKGWLIAGQLVPFNADEAIVALMARHILAGDFPIFFYGQAYMGSLDAFLAAAGFAVFGEGVAVIRWLQAALYMLTILSTALLAYREAGGWRSAAVAAWLLAVPAVNVTLYTTASLGNYGETLVLGNLQFLAVLRIANVYRQAASRNMLPDQTFSLRKAFGDLRILWFGWGLLAGFGLWTFGLSLVYTIPSAVYLVYLWWLNEARGRAAESRQPASKPRPVKHDQRGGLPAVGTLALAFLGALLGSAPWWIYAGRVGFSALLTELAGGAIAGVGGGTYLETIGVHTLNFLVFGTTVMIGLRPPWEFSWLAPPMMPFVLAVWIGLAAFILQRLRRLDCPIAPLYLLLAGLAATLAAGFVLTPFGADPSGRYFLPFAVLLAIFWGKWTASLYDRFGRPAYLAPAVLVVFHFLGTLQVARQLPPGLTTQFDPVARIDHRFDDDLIAFLESSGETRGYTNYWVAYPLAFRSNETLLFVPHLPYHPDFRYTERDDRYAPYTAAVASSDRAAYITTHHPALEDRLRATFTAQGIRWQEAQIGDYRIFYDLTGKIAPDPAGWMNP